MTYKKLEKKLDYPKNCPFRLARAVPNTDMFRFVCDLNCDIICKQPYIFRDDCPLEDWE